MNRVVVVLSVRWIDRHEREVAPILTLRQYGRFRRLGFGDRLGAEHVGDLVTVNGDEAHRLLAAERANAFLDAGVRHTKSPAAQDLDGNKVAVLRRAFVARLHCERATMSRLLVDGKDLSA